MTTTAAESTFIPNDFDPSNFDNIQPLLQTLLDRPLTSTTDIESFLTDLTSLSEIIYEYASRKNIDNACHTDDADKEAAYLHVVREIQPKLQPFFFELQKKFLAAPERHNLTFPGSDLLAKDWQADVDLFREQNIPLQTKGAELSTEYGKICGEMLVEFEGQTRTLQQMAAFLEETDRSTRQAAFELIATRRLEDRDKINNIFQQLLDLRHQIAQNADHKDYRDYIWLQKKRFDYTPQHCHDFADSVESLIMPLLNDLDEQRRQTLNLDTLKPWDTAVDVHSRPPLRPFDEKDIDTFIEKTRQTFDRISPDYASQFQSLKDNGNLDLDSRHGKRPGGFQAALEASKQPFIFMNAAGLQLDIEILLHEGGHAFHYIASRDIPIIFVRHASLEFCEVASMSMELLAADHYDIFYDDPQNAARAKRHQLEGVLRTLAWVAVIDQYQHWLYTNPGHSLEDRTNTWLSTLARFSSSIVDWSEHTDAQRAMWQRQLHLFQVPFYYIEYGIAQLGALNTWLNYKQDPTAALQNLNAAFALGGTKPLPQLFQTANIPFDFSQKTIAPLVTAIRNELDTLPE